MNREIEFRVWDRDLKKMRYLKDSHDFICFNEDGSGYYENMQTGLGDWFSDLMQYTGLKDKNGVKIFEGDIIHHNNIVDNADYVVEYKEGIYCGVRDNKYRSEEKMYLKLYMVELSDLEVIGNIYGKE